MRLLRPLLLAALVLPLVTFGLTTAPAHAAPRTSAAGTLSSVVNGTFTDAQGGQGTFTGTFTPQRFVQAGDQVVAEGELRGTLTDSTGAVVGTVTQPMSAPLAEASTGAATAGAARATAASCEILDLVLRPLDLDLLGLVVHLDRILLNITAESGAGNLLGNLLCAVVGLLDGGDLFGLAALLNNILGLLGLLL